MANCKSTQIVIVTFNAMPWIEECLDSAKDYDVIIVDNSSQDGTLKFISSRFPKTTILRQNENLGFGRANNIGIQHALEKGADYVFLLNQDAYLKRGCIENLVEVHQSNPEYGVLSPIHLNGSGSKLDRLFSIYLGYDGNPEFYSDFVLESNHIKTIYPVPFVNAAGWLLSKDCLQKVGGFDPIFIHYGEDENYCQRVLYKNLKVGVATNSFLMHDREDRVEKVKEHENLIDRFKELEKNYKIKFANLNENYGEELHEIKVRRRNSWIKSILQFKFHDGRYYRREYLMLKRIVPQIRKSREINSEKTTPHLGRESNYK